MRDGNFGTEESMDMGMKELKYDWEVIWNKAWINHKAFKDKSLEETTKTRGGVLIPGGHMPMTTSTRETRFGWDPGSRVAVAASG